MRTGCPVSGFAGVDEAVVEPGVSGAALVVGSTAGDEGAAELASRGASPEAPPAVSEGLFEVGTAVSLSTGDAGLVAGDVESPEKRARRTRNATIRMAASAPAIATISGVPSRNRFDFAVVA